MSEVPLYTAYQHALIYLPNPTDTQVFFSFVALDREIIFIELVTSDRTLKASREGSK